MTIANQGAENGINPSQIAERGLAEMLFTETHRGAACGIHTASVG
jgi:hypothetical protein